eukprot:95408_1
MSETLSSRLSAADIKLLDQIEKDAVEYIRLERCDLYCRSMGKLIPAIDLKEYLLNGFSVSKTSFGIGPNHQGYYTTNGYHNTANVVCYLYHDTYKKLPPILCHKANFCRIMYYPTFGCDDINNELLFDIDPRTLCLKQISNLENKYKMSIYSCFEHEFQIFIKQTDNKTLKKTLWEHKGFMDNILLSEHNDFIIDCERSLRFMNVYLETIHLESQKGCYEWTMKPSYNINSADNSFTYKTIIKEIAMKRDWIASFSSTPECDDNTGCSNGTHFNHSLWDINKKINMFYDENSDDKLSLIAKYWIGGILKHICGITCFSVSTLNCFRRINNHIYAPAHASWGYNNRRVMIRVKRGNLNNKNIYLEYRLPGSACNPYLVLASIIIAGIDGIKNKILPYCKPCSANDNPYIGHLNINHRFKKIPINLSQSLNHLLNDKIICNAFGTMFIESFVGKKK